MLRVVANKAKNDKFEGEQYARAWEGAYGQVLDHYVEKVKKYATTWLKSEAGKRFSEAFQSAKSKGKKLPSLTFDAFRRFEDVDGMDWGMPQLWDFYSVLGEYSDTGPVDHSVTTHLLRPIRD